MLWKTKHTGMAQTKPNITHTMFHNLENRCEFVYRIRKEFGSAVPDADIYLNKMSFIKSQLSYQTRKQKATRQVKASEL